MFDGEQCRTAPFTAGGEPLGDARRMKKIDAVTSIASCNVTHSTLNE